MIFMKYYLEGHTLKQCALATNMDYKSTTINWASYILYLVINSAFIGTPGKASKIFLSKVLKTSTYKITLVIFRNKSSQF